METIRAALNELILASDFKFTDLDYVLSYEKFTHEMIAASATKFLGIENVAIVHELLKTDFLLQPKSEIPPLVVGWYDTEMHIPYQYEFFFMDVVERQSVIAFFVDLVLQTPQSLIIDDIFERNQVSFTQLSPDRVSEIVIDFDNDGEICDCENDLWQSQA